MPLGFERLNERTSRPNVHINFLKPLPGPTETTARTYLERVAAIMYPIMKSNCINVMSLEEYAPNPEFAGRNFNAGEVIQLVLKARNGAWLPFRHVQMVMVHELAHCKQMNHSRFFWQVRNQYAEELRSLWAKRYTGEGLWGRGRSLEDGAFTSIAMPDASQLPQNVCGGTYRSKGRKRRRGGADKPQMSYAEKRQRRVLKKFGAGGVTLGSDEEARAQLEAGKKTKGKPRVAGSARGRELRAAAVLARLEKSREAEVKTNQSTESDTESEYEWPPSEEDVREEDVREEDVREQDGDEVLFVRVCEEEDPHDEDVEREMQELLDANLQGDSNETARGKDSGSSAAETSSSPASPSVAMATKATEPKPGQCVAARDGDSSFRQVRSPPRNARNRSTTGDGHDGTPSGHDSDTVQICSACSLVNEADVIICAACSNVLRPKSMPNSWKCQSAICRGGAYTNIGDYGRCQLCGAERPTSKA